MPLHRSTGTPLPTLTSSFAVVAVAWALLGSVCCPESIYRMGGSTPHTDDPLCVPPDADTRTVTNEGQQQDLWCWAAVTQMILGYRGGSVEQCAIVRKGVPVSTDYPETITCCEPNMTPDEDGDGDMEEDPCVKANCNEAGRIALGEYGVTYTTETTPLTWDALTKELACDNRVMGYQYGESGSSDYDHMVLIKGYEDRGGFSSVLIVDPYRSRETLDAEGTVSTSSMLCDPQEFFISYDEYTTPSAYAAPTTETFYKIGL